MPPKPKFTKDEIISVALDMVSKEGISVLTARDLGKALGSSARPIFTVFKNMEEVQEEIQKAAMKRFESHISAALPNMPLFKQIGMQMVLFGMKEPKLYQLLFMHENLNANSFEDVFGKLGATANVCIEAICRDYALSQSEAKQLFENMWIYTFGVGTLCATNVCRFSEEELSEMLSDEFRAFMLLIISKRENSPESKKNVSEKQFEV